MNRTIALCLTMSMLLSCQYARHTQEPPQAFSRQPDFRALGIDSARMDRIDALLQDYVDKGILPHALTFVAKNAQVLHNKAFGWKDVEKRIPLGEDDIFRMYSQTKAITTVALMTLFEQGKFQLDDPVSAYIPEMTDRVWVEASAPGDLRTRAAASPVLIRHVLSHTSGITGPRPVPGMPGVEHETLEAYVKDLVKHPLAYDPGSGWNYHPSSDVWAYLVEYFSGKPLRDYVREAVLEPLGIRDMDYYYPAETAERFVTMYREKDGQTEPVEMWSGRYPFDNNQSYASGGTGLNGTIEGYARFCQMIANGGVFNHRRILGRRTLEIMAKDQVSHPGGGEAAFRFGLGFQIYPGESPSWETLEGSSPMVSPGALSWGGMANTDYLIDPSEGLIILLYTNRVPDTKVWEKFLNTVYQILE